ncbi:DNA-directed RNA polymerase subunit omega [Kroppenstedtia eburnea]|uniref:DNA-directed RNA polymerase subunit omega n=1 Tax=Kroppenstedtia eburnea TaxID=714067 RepID=A0A1N7J2R1_9BACL|nr:DNA-directed RNA polymerase subunit omega [Kroppenstedtia eburnea]EGK13273.1 DNA-directed RNA polymerase subunit omega [Desmospora sp. 8437]QKI82445.1 DNA-directed RNA polymerase subunit omega [Kroppenstedtia eburnea]SIS43501.1 DNA-directed RNA polymerase subunit omega [Kroppenstedtia eburnea]
MLYPSIDKLMSKADSKYTLVILAAKRARQLLDGATPDLQPRSHKHVGVALEEIVEDYLVPPPEAGGKKK